MDENDPLSEYNKIPLLVLVDYLAGLQEEHKLHNAKVELSTTKYA